MVNLVQSLHLFINSFAISTNQISHLLLSSAQTITGTAEILSDSGGKSIPLPLRHLPVAVQGLGAESEARSYLI
ncbi:hypothetical protein RchiOBHm_Chr7g0227091 [Rosa chinensis]|uniref:Uncharacterized protein n=1 Tax=Rosa chinensis TaxID=74649 RepID=A0A2P6PEH9_ROSCH|nr:hypothetical protein RchiOBHm_Chr7g0227091 [Rosa chinensis]